MEQPRCESQNVCLESANLCAPANLRFRCNWTDPSVSSERHIKLALKEAG